MFIVFYILLNLKTVGSQSRQPLVAYCNVWLFIAAGNTQQRNGKYRSQKGYGAEDNGSAEAHPAPRDYDTNGQSGSYPTRSGAPRLAIRL